MIVYELCDQQIRATCKSQEQISDALQFSYLMILENQQLYEHVKYPGDEKQIYSFSNVKFYPISKYE